MFNREKAKASIHYKPDPVGFVPYGVIIRDGESNACEFGQFSNYDSARYFATTNAATIEFDCGRFDSDMAELESKWVVRIENPTASRHGHFGYFGNSDTDLLSQIAAQRDAWIAEQFDAGHFSHFYSMRITERRTDGSFYAFTNDELRAVFNGMLKLASSATHDDMPFGC